MQRKQISRLVLAPFCFVLRVVLPVRAGVHGTEGFAGDFADLIGKFYPQKLFVHMTFEYGTLNSQTTSGSIKSIHNTILENQGNSFGYSSSKVWRTMILKQTRVILPKVIERLSR